MRRLIALITSPRPRAVLFGLVLLAVLGSVRLLVAILRLLVTLLLFVIMPWRWLTPFRWLWTSKWRYHYIGGTYDPGARNLPRTALELHADFFDGNGDGVLTIRESARGLRAVNVVNSLLASLFFAFAINVLLGRKTWQTLLPTLTLNCDAIHLAMHGSATKMFLSSGALNHDALDRFVNEYSRDGQITEQALARLMTDKREPGFVGRFFATQELPVIERITGGPGISERDFRDFFEGSLLPRLRDESAAARPA